MAGESFYTYLGGPRTFWGQGRTVINNNIYTGSYMPNFIPFHHHCCGNNFISKMMGWGMLFNLVDNMFGKNKPTHDDGYYPYVNVPEGAGGNTTNTTNNTSTTTSSENVQADFENSIVVTPEEETVEETPDITAEETEENNTEVNENNSSNHTHKTKRRSPKGWYPANNDKNKNLHFGSIENLRKLAANDGKKAPAVYILDQLLKTKCGKLSDAHKIMLLNELIKKNPSVFEKNGQLKKNADLSKLDLPSMDFIKTLPPTRNAKIYRGNNGCYAVHQTDGTYKYYIANGTEIKEKDFKRFNPSIYAQINQHKTTINTTSPSTGLPLNIKV